MAGSTGACAERGLGGVPVPGASLAYTTNNGSAAAAAVAVFPDAAVWDGLLVQRVVTLSIIMLFTLVGNTAIVAVLARPRRAKRASSRVNLFILHLAIGDLAVGLFTQSSEMLFEVSGGWVLGAAGCKLVVYVQMVTLASTTFILTSMSYDRYAAICRPLETCSGMRRARAMLAASWALAFIVAVPQLFIFVQVQTGVTTSGRPHLECRSVGYTRHWQRQLYFSWFTFYILVVPGLLISAFYLRLLRVVWAASASEEKDASRGGESAKKTTAMRPSPAAVINGRGPMLRRCTLASRPLLPRARAKTLKLTVCIIASFLLCWIPYFTVHNVRIHSHYCIKVPRGVIVFAETVALINSAVNPIFYGLFNVHIRRGLCDILPWSSNASRNRSISGRDSTFRIGGAAVGRTAPVSTTTCALDAGSLASPALAKRQSSRQYSLRCMDVSSLPLVALNGNTSAVAQV